MVIIGPTFEHCEVMAQRLGMQRKGRYYYAANGGFVRFVTDPAVLERIPRHVAVVDAFAGVFNHELAARFAAILTEFAQYGESHETA